MFKTFEEFLTEKSLMGKPIKERIPHVSREMQNIILEFRNNQEQLERIRALLDEGADPTEALKTTINAGQHESLAKIFLKYGANPNANGLLCNATYYNMDHVVKYLLEYKANPNTLCAISKSYPAMIVAKDDNVELLELFVKYGADVSSTMRDPFNNTTLSFAIQKNAKKCIRYLLKNKLVDLSKEVDAMRMAPIYIKDKKILALLGL